MTRAQLEDLRTAVAEAEARLAMIAERLRDTAQGLRSGEVNAWHAANRLDKIAGEIAGSSNSSNRKRGM